MSKEHPQDTCEKGERGCTCSEDNKRHVHYVGPQNSPNTQTCHETIAPPWPLPPEPPSLTSSHASSESCKVATSASSDVPLSCWMDGTFASTMALRSSQKETKESLEEQDLRGGGLPCPDETSEWRSLNKAGMGDCLKSPKMGHWQEEVGSEL